MASQGVAANSRLAQLQIRFQQKQLQERELKRVEMSDEATKKVGNGKVRQMFDERRRGAGIDRSIPLKPIATTATRTAASMTSLHTTSVRTGGSNTLLSRKQSQPALGAAPRQLNSRRTLTGTEVTEQNLINGNVPGHLRTFKSDTVDYADDEPLPKAFSSLSLREGRIATNGTGSGDTNNNEYARVMSSNGLKLNPVIMKKSPNAVSTRAPPRQTTPLNSANRLKPARASPIKPAASVRTPPRKIVATAASVKMSIKPKLSAGTPQPGMAACTFCGRHFLEERLGRHEQVCQKMATTRRKVFDASKHRVQGTEAEIYAKKAPKHTTRNVASVNSTNLSTANTTSPPKKNNWRQKHEEFIAAIRAAKQLQIHLAKGGKLSDLPPPPPSENPDYIQCPHCSRRFNQGAAERHIPKCANMLHNKPKPGAKATLKRR